MNKSLRWLGFAALATLLVACSKDKNQEKPTELTEFTSTAKVERVWSASVGAGAPRLRVGLEIAIAGDTVFAANHKGVVYAYDRATGKRRWDTKTKLPLTGGPGVGEGLVVAGASHGEIIALDAGTGAVRWKSQINSEILAGPTISGQAVLLRTTDGRVTALRVSDGTQLWSAEQAVPRLSLRGTTRPAVAGTLAVSGFDNGRVLALQLADGATVWDVSVSPPTGRTELDRLNDIDAAVEVAGNDIFAVTYQGKAVRIDRDTGQVLWSRDVSSYSGLALDEDSVYITSSSGELVKIGRRNGVEVWKQSVLSRRRLSAPAVLGEYVAVGDLDGYVHFFDRATGTLAARIRPFRDAVAAPLVSSGDAVFALDGKGKLVALRVKALPVAPAPAAAAPAPAETPAPAATPAQ
jgi:outer membrane protein assembly factor BamB